MQPLMISFRTPNARPWRIGVWISPLFAAAALLVFFLVLPLMSPAQGGTTSATLKQQLAQQQAALNQAYAELDALQDELNGLANAHNAAETRLGELEAEINEAENCIARSEDDLDSAREQLEARLVSLYKDGSSSSSKYLEVLFAGEDLVSVLERFDMLTKMADQDQELFAEVKGYLQAAKENRALLEENKAEQTAQMAELVRLQEATSTKLAGSAAQYNNLKSQIAALTEEIRKVDARAAAAAAAARARARAAAAAKAAAARKAYSGGGTVQPGPFVFPVAGPHSYVDSFGAPRPGGRAHKGIDIMAARGTACVACVSGTISRAVPTDSGLGGISLYLNGSDGTVFYYAHLNGLASGIATGSPVSGGQVIGFVGSTGNAGSCNHLHFEMRPGGGAAINPYPTLRAHDG